MLKSGRDDERSVASKDDSSNAAGFIKNKFTSPVQKQIEKMKFNTLEPKI